MPFASGRPQAVISVCTSCRSAVDGDTASPGDVLLAALRAAAAADGTGPIAIRPVQCLSVCKRPCTAALSGPDRYTYVFGDLDPAAAAAPLLECARLFVEAEHGYLLWRERPEPLRRGILARIPPAGLDSADGRHPR